MKGIKKLAAQIATSAALVTLVSASVFAEDRPSRETWRDNDRERVEARSDSRRSGNGRSDSYSNRGGYKQRSQVQYYSGRVTKYDRYRDGYRVYVSGAPYPFFVSGAQWNRSPFRVGVAINIGGYYNPTYGYYDYYDNAYYGNGAGYAGDYVQGYVDRVDYRRGTFTVQDPRSRQFITVVMRNRDRFFDDLRRGDYVEVSGGWDRGGVFAGYRIDDVDPGR